MSESIINQIKQEIASKEEAIKNFEQLKNEIDKLRSALATLESNNLPIRENDNKDKSERGPLVRPYISRKELDERILKEANSLASSKTIPTISVGEIRNNLLPESNLHGGMNNLQLYNRIYFVLSRRPDLFQKSGDKWLLSAKNKD